MKVKLIWINLLLGLFILFETYMIYQMWTASDEWDIPSGATTDSGSRQTHLTLTKRIRARDSFTDVVNKNIFSMHRREFIAQAKPETAAAPPPKQQIDREPAPAPFDSNRVGLFGVIVVGDYCKALVKDASDREQPMKWIQQGDTVDTFVVKRIKKDRIIISGSGKLFTVLLYDKKNPKERRQTPRSARAVKKGTTPPSGPVKTQPPKVDDNDKYEIIKTPLGEFKRKKQ